jgi:hypothetical protein
MIQAQPNCSKTSTKNHIGRASKTSMELPRTLDNANTQTHQGQRSSQKLAAILKTQRELPM